MVITVDDCGGLMLMNLKWCSDTASGVKMPNIPQSVGVGRGQCLHSM